MSAQAAMRLVQDGPTPSGAINLLGPKVTTDEHVVDLWLKRFDSPNTRISYRRTVDLFFAAVGSIRGATLDKMQAWIDNLGGKPASRSKHIACIRSLFKFCCDAGYIQFNIARFFRQPKTKDNLPEKILSEEDMLLLINAAKGRDHVILRIGYACGLRVGEITGLKWRDIQPRSDGRGQLTIFGKGRKTRVVVVEKPETFTGLMELKGSSGPNDPVFKSRSRGGHLDRASIMRMMRVTAKRAGLGVHVWPHVLRHCHASHALDAGIPLHEIQATLGHSSISTTSRYLHVRPDHSSGRALKV